MKKLRYLPLILLALLLLLCFSGCEKAEQQPTLDDLAELWREIYGEEAIAELPGRENAYALLYPEGYPMVYMEPNSKYTEYKWERLYTGDEYSLSVRPGEYYPGDVIIFDIRNENGQPLYHRYIESLLELQINGEWYPVHHPSRSCSWPGGQVESFTTLSGFDIALNAGKTVVYDERHDEYEIKFQTSREIELIPGHYRCLLALSTEDTNEAVWLSEEFDISEPKPVRSPENPAKPGMDELAALWKDIYGEDMVAKLPGRENEYALITKDKGLNRKSDTTAWGEQAMNLHFLTPRMDFKLPTDERLTVKLKQGIYRPGDPVFYTLSNTTGEELRYEYTLYIKADGLWYPVVMPHRWSLASSSVQPGDYIKSLQSYDLTRMVGSTYSYDEELEEYVYNADYVRPFIEQRDIRLIPGTYRYIMTCTSKGFEDIVFGFDFDIFPEDYGKEN